MASTESNPSGANATVAKNKGEQGNKLLTFPTQEMPHSILLVFKKYKYEKWANSKRDLLKSPTRGGRSSPVELNGSVGIQLPFPKQLVDSNDIRIATFERNALVEGAIAMDGVESFLKGQGTLGGGLKALKGAAAEAAKGVFGAAKDAGAYLSSKSGEQMLADAKGLADAQMGGSAGAGLAYLLRSKAGNILGGSGIATMNAVLGQTVNPRETLTFEGVGLKSHSFEWELYPSNKNDSEMIKQIVATVKRNTLPSTSEFFGIPRVLLNFPSTCDMYLLGVDQSHFMKFKTCMVAQVSVNYSAGGGITAIAKGGVPAAVSLSMSFQELDIETADDWTSGLLPDEIGETAEGNGSSGGGTGGSQNSGGG